MMKQGNLLLKVYSITLTFALVIILFTSSKDSDPNRVLDEITVERINIIEPDGKLKMVISNQHRQHPGMIDGEPFEERQRAPGILFFNEEQDEIGGLGYYGNEKTGGNQIYLSFDQYKNDQVMQLMHYTNSDGDNRYGLNVWERDKEITQPIFLHLMDSLDQVGLNYGQKIKYLNSLNNGSPILAQRLFVGKNYNGEAGLFVHDNSGNDRIRIYVDENNQPKIELLDEQGKVIRDLLMNE